MYAYKDTPWDIAYRNAYRQYFSMGYRDEVLANLARAKAELTTGKQG
jgi:hypothetical protein